MTNQVLLWFVLISPWLSIFAMPKTSLIGIYQLINHTSWNIFLTFLGLSIVLYAYQIWQDGAFENVRPVESEKKRIHFKRTIQ